MRARRCMRCGQTTAQAELVKQMAQVAAVFMAQRGRVALHTRAGERGQSLVQHAVQLTPAGQQLPGQHQGDRPGQMAAVQRGGLHGVNNQRTRRAKVWRNLATLGAATARQ